MPLGTANHPLPQPGSQEMFTFDTHSTAALASVVMGNERTGALYPVATRDSRMDIVAPFANVVPVVENRENTKFFCTNRKSQSKTSTETDAEVKLH